MTKLQENLAVLQPGDVPDPAGCIASSPPIGTSSGGSAEDGIEAYKLQGRMEQVLLAATRSVVCRRAAWRHSHVVDPWRTPALGSRSR